LLMLPPKTEHAKRRLTGWRLCLASRTIPCRPSREVSRPNSLTAQYSWAVTGHLLFEQTN
ncbi:GPHN isoform 17, partial [Pan troglodytes]